MNKNWSQAYKIVPWRGQLQWLGNMTISLIAVTLVAWLYLSISSKAGIAGRELQTYQYQKSKAEDNIAQLETDLARTTSSTEMSKRAKKLGFKEVDPTRFTYMVIPNYAGRPSAILAPDTVGTLQEKIVNAEFTRSIWDWMYTSFIEPSSGY